MNRNARILSPFARLATLTLGIVTSAAAVIALPSSEALAGPTAQASVGISYLLNDDPLDSSRGPMTFEVGPGWQASIIRVELPLVLGVLGDNVFPPESNGILGIRPSLKIFPLNALYGKIATQIFWAGNDNDVYFGISLGGGLELTAADVLGIFGEITVNPYFTPDNVLPLEARAGVTLKF